MLYSTKLAIILLNFLPEIDSNSASIAPKQNIQNSTGDNALQQATTRTQLTAIGELQNMEYGTDLHLLDTNCSEITDITRQIIFLSRRSGSRIN